MSHADNLILKQLAGHRLTLIQSGKVTAYRLHREGTRMMSTLIIFSPEGIVLQGDLTPERNGSVSCIGYGLDWFAQRLSGSYLCEKFLTKRWVSELAVEALRDPNSYLREDATPLQIERLNQLVHELKYDGHDAEWLHEELSSIRGYTVDEIPGWGYDPQEKIVLCAIQQRFAELYAAAAPALPAPIPRWRAWVLRYLCPWWHLHHSLMRPASMKSYLRSKVKEHAQ